MEVGVQGVMGGRGEFSQSLTPAAWSVGGSGELGCAGQVVFFFVVVVFLDDEAEVAAVCIYPAGRGFSSRAAAGRGRLRWREGGRMTRKPVHCLSHAPDRSLVCSSCLHRSTER